VTPILLYKNLSHSKWHGRNADDGTWKVAPPPLLEQLDFYVCGALGTDMSE
jgi:hypothetical protein